MISEVVDSGGRLIGIEVKPNSSATRRTFTRAFLLIAFPLIAEGLFFASMGYWPILLYTLLTLAAVGYGFRMAYHSSLRREFVAFEDDEITIEKGRRALESRHPFKRAWAQVVLSPQSPLGPLSRLFIRSHGQQVEVGAFLDENERRLLAQQLQQLLR